MSYKSSRRAFLAGCALSLSSFVASSPVFAQNKRIIVERNSSGFRTRGWRSYFSSLRNGAILVDTDSRALHYWSEDQRTYLLYPSSIPLTEELTRRGRTVVVQKVIGPEWRPTPSMRKRNPRLPEHVPPGPDNPLGTHALYLSWEYFRIHGTHDPEKIGRRSSSGCFGLFNEDIEELFQYARIGTQVRVI